MGLSNGLLGRDDTGSMDGRAPSPLGPGMAAVHRVQESQLWARSVSPRVGGVVTFY